MNWELIRIGIDVLTLLMAILFAVVLYFAYKSYQKVAQPIMAVKNMLTPPAPKTGNQQPETGAIEYGGN